MTRFRHAAIHLVLAALILRAFLPAGWMPAMAAGTGEGMLVLCTMDGPVRIDSEGNRHAMDEGRDGAKTPCPFGLTGPGDLPAHIVVLAGPAPTLLEQAQAKPSLTVSPQAFYRPQAPRAPPGHV